MSDTPSPSPSEDPLAALIAAFLKQPESPAGLRLQSMINRGLRPLAEARLQVLDALVAQINGAVPHPAAQAAVDAAHQHLAGVLRLRQLSSESISELATQARAIAKRRGPPTLESLVPQAAGRSDVGYAEGLHLVGIRGAWHRLWAMMVMRAQFGDGDGVAAAELEVREQLERALGFRLEDEQLAKLRENARAHARNLSASN